MACAVRGWLALVMLVFAVIRVSAAEPKRVLLLHSFGPQFAPWVFFAGHFRDELFKQSPDRIDLYEASLEGARFQRADEQRPVVDYLVSLFGAPERRAIDYAALTPKDAPVAVRLEFSRWIESVLQVLPETTHIAWVVGASPLERFWTKELQRISEPFADRVSFEWFNDLRFDEMLDRVSK